MEIVARAVVMFAFLWMITRVVGRVTLGELSTFQLLLYVTMGDLVQQAITQQDFSLTGGVLAISVFALLTIALSWINTRWRGAAPVTHGVPVVVVRNGDPLLDVMHRERLSLPDLMAAARENGVQQFTDIELAVLEADGKISFFTYSGGLDGMPDRSRHR
ncbi:MAG TPA: YetF domain-containing protein [Pseudonocardiaceae bacterium]|jgi:uncharacterized membrane protein YcaP (DUF421 family)|nr:YetF domain-containing protein [Pseudonocardiaceae bacterium]